MSLSNCPFMCASCWVYFIVWKMLEASTKNIHAIFCIKINTSTRNKAIVYCVNNVQKKVKIYIAINNNLEYQIFILSPLIVVCFIFTGISNWKKSSYGNMIAKNNTILYYRERVHQVIAPKYWHFFSEESITELLAGFWLFYSTLTSVIGIALNRKYFSEPSWWRYQGFLTW